MGRDRKGVVAASETSIEITFAYRGKRCRERIKLAPTPANLKRAEQHRAAILDAIAKGTFIYRDTFPDSKRAAQFATSPGEKINVENYLDDWLKQKKEQLKASTYVGYKDTVISHLTPALGKLIMIDLRRSHIVEMCKGWDVSDKTTRNRLSVLRASLSDAVQSDIIEVNPMYGWSWQSQKKTKKQKKQHVDPFTADEQAAILKVIISQEHNLIQFAFWTGLRTSEIVGLDWGDIDFRRGEIHVRRALTRAAIQAGEDDEGTKTEASDRRVKLLAPALKALNAQRNHTQPQNAAVFHNPRTNERWRGSDPIWDAWKRILLLAKVKYRNPYQTRHTYASMMLTAGESDRWVASQMGHTDVGMINRIYGKWIPDARPDAGSKAVALFGKKLKKKAEKKLA